MKKHSNDFGNDSVPGLVLRTSIPFMFAQFVNVLYSIVDRMYIGNIANVGDIALAGVGICGPIVTMISAFAAWIGNGGAPLLSIKSGEQNKEGASAILANCFVLLIGMAVCLTTALFCMPLEEGQKLVESLDDVEAMWCTPDKQATTSSGWDSHLKK